MIPAGRIKIGVIGCGDIAQIQHLPALKELAEEYDVAYVCDVSPSLAKYVASWFDVPHYTTNYQELLESDLDAVILCHRDPKTDIAVASFNAGKHTFIEKPMCYSVQEADRIIEAADKSGKIGQVGYMKLHEPAFELAQREVSTMQDIRFVQVNHLHTNNNVHVEQFRTKKFDDIPDSIKEQSNISADNAIKEAIGDISEEIRRTFVTISGSMIHDIYGLRVLLGNPTRVVSTEIWEGAVNIVLEYPGGFRGVATWVDLPDAWDFEETLEVYGSSKRVMVSYTTGFQKAVSPIKIVEVDKNGMTFRKEPALSWENPFRRELRQFHDSIVDNKIPRASVQSARDDISLVIDIIRSNIENRSIQIN